MPFEPASHMGCFKKERQMLEMRFFELFIGKEGANIDFDGLSIDKAEITFHNRISICYSLLRTFHDEMQKREQSLESALLLLIIHPRAQRRIKRLGVALESKKRLAGIDLMSDSQLVYDRDGSCKRSCVEVQVEHACLCAHFLKSNHRTCEQMFAFVCTQSGVLISEAI